MAGKDVQRFGPYVILERIGDGGMAEIFLAKMQGYSGFEKLIGLKKILPRYSQNRTFAQMLIHEAKLAAALQHFNVVQVLDLGEIDRQVFIAMEYVRGRDLAAVLSNTYRRKERLPLNLVLCIATEFMTGLDYAHRLRNSDGVPLGIIHRDISPQNVLISYEGEVKVTDFGIARVLAEKDGFQLPGNLHGKFGYMSPEQVLGQEIDQRSDIFSAGVVLYEMLTGQRLFRGKEHKETIKMIVSNVIPPPSAINTEVPPSVDRICAKALARDRNLRYQTMGALLGELSRVADTLPRRAATRDLSVYMRRQFGNAAGAYGHRPKSESDRSVSQVSGFRGSTGISQLAGAIQTGQRVPLGEILIGQGAIGEAELEIALAEQRARGGRIGELLVASGNLAEDDLLVALATQSSLPTISETDLDNLVFPANLLRRFPREAADATMMIPLPSIEGDAESMVRLAVSDPYDDRAILETKVVLGVNDVMVYLAKRSAIRNTIAKWYGGEPSDMEVLDDNQFTEVAQVHTPVQPEPSPIVPIVVLIADGDQSAIEPIVARLKEEECEVVAVTDGKSARQICREKRPVVAILDAGLPGIDGYNVLLELRSQNADAAVFITSSRNDEERHAKALELGADDFIVKPFSLELTTSKVRREIQKRSGGRKALAPPVAFSGISGSLKDMTALDIVQTLELGKKTAHVVLQYSDGRSGELNVRSGDLRGAIAGNLLGEEAFYLLVRPWDGLFRIEYKRSTTPENLTKPNTFLMIEAMRRLDESDREHVVEDRLQFPSSLDSNAPLTPVGRIAPGQSVLDAQSVSPINTPPPKVRTPSRSRERKGIVTPPPQELARIQTTHPAFDEDSPGLAVATDADRVPSPRSVHAPEPTRSGATIVQPAGKTMRTLPSGYVPEYVRSSGSGYNDAYLEPSVPPPSEEKTVVGLQSRFAKPLTSSPTPVWDDGAAGWHATVPTPNPPLKSTGAPSDKTVANPISPAMPSFAALAGDLILEGAPEKQGKAPDEKPASARKALLSPIATESDKERREASAEQHATTAERAKPQDYSEGPTKIGRIPIRRVTSFVERVERSIVDPATDETGKAPKRSGKD